MESFKVKKSLIKKNHIIQQITDRRNIQKNHILTLRTYKEKMEEENFNRGYKLCFYCWIMPAVCLLVRINTYEILII